MLIYVIFIFIGTRIISLGAFTCGHVLPRLKGNPVPQTGSGKTYTMGTGLEVDSITAGVQGIVPRAVQHLFLGITERRKAAIDAGKTPPEFKVTAHFMELYNEDVIDLFDPGFKVSTKGKDGAVSEDTSLLVSAAFSCWK